MNDTLQAQSRTISRWGDDITIRLQPHNYGIDVRAVLYKGGIDKVPVDSITILTNRTYQFDDADAAQAHYDMAVMVLADA